MNLDEQNSEAGIGFFSKPKYRTSAPLLLVDIAQMKSSDHSCSC
jgi:hypothetical protein